MAKNQYLYRRPETMDVEDSHSLESNFSDGNGKWLAEAAAEDYHRKHDGWESTWPIEFIIMRTDGSVIGKYSVDREYDPSFHATEVHP